MKHFKDTDGSLWAYELDGSQDHLIREGMIQVTDEEAAVIREELTAKANAAFMASMNYSEKRVMHYPTIGDQLDALYHAGVFPEEMAARLKAVKDQFPKT